MGSIPGQGTRIPHAAWHGLKDKNKNKKTTKAGGGGDAENESRYLNKNLKNLELKLSNYASLLKDDRDKKISKPLNFGSMLYNNG